MRREREEERGIEKERVAQSKQTRKRDDREQRRSKQERDMYEAASDENGLGDF